MSSTFVRTPPRKKSFQRVQQLRSRKVSFLVVESLKKGKKISNKYLRSRLRTRCVCVDLQEVCSQQQQRCEEKKGGGSKGSIAYMCNPFIYPTTQSQPFQPLVYSQPNPCFFKNQHPSPPSLHLLPERNSFERPTYPIPPHSSSSIKLGSPGEASRWRFFPMYT